MTAKEAVESGNGMETLSNNQNAFQKQILDR